MTDEQLDLLRNTIQREISYAIQENEGFMWAFETAEECDKLWETLKETFKND